MLPNPPTGIVHLDEALSHHPFSPFHQFHLQNPNTPSPPASLCNCIHTDIYIYIYILCIILYLFTCKRERERDLKKTQAKKQSCCYNPTRAGRFCLCAPHLYCPSPSIFPHSHSHFCFHSLSLSLLLSILSPIEIAFNLTYIDMYMSGHIHPYYVSTIGSLRDREYLDEWY